MCLFRRLPINTIQSKRFNLSGLCRAVSPSPSPSPTPAPSRSALAALSRSQFVVCLIDLIAWVWWPVQDTTRRDATTLAVYVRDVVVVVVAGSDLLWLASAPLPSPYPRCLLVLPCQMSCCESIFGCMHRPPQLPLAIMHLKGFRTINLCRLQGINKSRYRRRRRRCRC